MKAVILAGGYGSRMSEETTVRPKPMVEIGVRPILWHIMKIYSAYGINDFVICLGYKGHMIKDFFVNYPLLVEDVHCDLENQKTEIMTRRMEPWKVTLVETGENTQTGGRLKRVRDYVGDETFCMTYGDGVCDVNIADLVAFHREQKTLATVTAVQPPGRFGYFSLPGNRTKVAHFREKPQGDGAWVNGGFFVLEPGIFDYIQEDATRWEIEPLEQLAAEGQLAAFRHPGFWQCMDHLRDKIDLDRLWNEGRAPWNVWEN
ncbi:MAG TPA: glucose-1-phosphate cytidylyltransferase [Kiritimatiellia bacterium]|nr:glucose-1-phosphate cytidylyltransferase [Kiritimatiellia bacterium]HMO99339.1 glucose-1-phosphate cytidylyltransferase [Kiritimatiellia bacterium]HMP96097.1 glucose-1-phosphate cytidylyltransferase [Kiritimatiellia bacterium]